MDMQDVRTAKECKGCGKDFVPSSASQVYCKECQELGHRRAYRNGQLMEAATRRNLATYYDIDVEVRQAPCGYCGKPVNYVVRNGKVRELPGYCSEKCRLQAKIEATKCAWCGKPMSETDDQRDVKGHDWFCSEGCREASAWDTARKEGTVKVCPICGKEFLRRTGTFCSMECAREGQRRRPNPERPKKSATSKQERLRRSAAWGKQKQQNTAERKKQSEEEYIKNNGLCPICCVPYMDCERMLSEFRVLPKGTRMHDGKIMACPKFRTKAIKYLTQEDMEQIAENTFKASS